MTEDTQRQSGPAAPQPKPRLDLWSSTAPTRWSSPDPDPDVWQHGVAVASNAI